MSTSDEFPVQEDKMSERRKWGTRDFVFIITLLMNLGGFIWGAATTKATTDAAIETMKATAAELKQDAKVDRSNWEPRLRLAETEIAVIKAQIYLIEREGR